MKPKDTPLLVLGYLLLGMIILLAPNATADNEVNLEQTGSNLNLNITQAGAKNTIGMLDGQSYINATSLSIHINQFQTIFYQIIQIFNRVFR